MQNNKPGVYDVGEFGMKEKNTVYLMYTSLYIALIFVLTFLIKIPVPPGGYIHPGDALVIPAGIILGKKKGMFAGACGGALADFMGGFYMYIPATIISKALMAAVTCIIYKKTEKIIFAAVPVIIINCGIYFIADYIMFGRNYGIYDCIMNLVQTGVGIILAVAVMRIFKRINLKKEEYEG